MSSVDSTPTNDSEYNNDQIANLLEKQMATHYEKLKSLPIFRLDL